MIQIRGIENTYKEYETLSVQKVDIDTGLGIQGAVIKLQCPDGQSCTGITNADGYICFRIRKGSGFTLCEVSSPPGYQKSDMLYGNLPLQ